MLNRQGGQSKNITGPLMYLHVVNEMVGSSSFKSKVARKELIGLLSFIYKEADQVADQKLRD